MEVGNLCTVRGKEAKVSCWKLLQDCGLKRSSDAALERRAASTKGPSQTLSYTFSAALLEMQKNFHDHCRVSLAIFCKGRCVSKQPCSWDC